MQMDRLTLKSQEALQQAQHVAQGYSHQEVDGEHLLLAMLGQQELDPGLIGADWSIARQTSSGPGK
jgi:ATP-dependent Clp protease ATP-binding subunit ClpB